MNISVCFLEKIKIDNMLFNFYIFINETHFFLQST